MNQKLTGSPVEDGPADDMLPANDRHELLFKQGLEGGRGFLASNGENLGQSHGLPVCYHSQRLQGCHRKSGARLGFQVGPHVFVILGPRCHSDPSGYLADDHSAGTGVELVREDFLQLFRVYRILRDIDDRFKNGLQLVDVHGSQAASPDGFPLEMWISWKFAFW